MVDLLTWRPLFYVVAPVAIATELFLAVGLWLPRTRLVAIRVAIVFHLAIELGARVEVFSLAAIAALVIWVTPHATRPRRPPRPPHALRPGRWLRVGARRSTGWIGSRSRTPDRGILTS